MTAQSLHTDHQEDKATGRLAGDTELAGNGDLQAEGRDSQEATLGDFINTAVPGRTVKVTAQARIPSERRISMSTLSRKSASGRRMLQRQSVESGHH